MKYLDFAADFKLLKYLDNLFEQPRRACFHSKDTVGLVIEATSVPLGDLFQLPNYMSIHSKDMVDFVIGATSAPPGDLL